LAISIGPLIKASCFRKQWGGPLALTPFQLQTRLHLYALQKGLEKFGNLKPYYKLFFLLKDRMPLVVCLSIQRTIPS
jgi:hypothetical protein